MNKGLKQTLIISGVVGVGVGLYFFLRKKKKKLNNTNTTNTNTTNTNTTNNNTTNSDTLPIYAIAENGLIVISRGNNTYRYQVQTEIQLDWWVVEVVELDWQTKVITFKDPQTNQQSTEELEQSVVDKITQGVGASEILIMESDEEIYSRTKLKLV